MSTSTLTNVAARRTTSSGVIVWVVAVMLAAALLYYSLRDIEWRQVWVLIRGANPLYLALGCAFSSAALFLRALRWRTLLEAEGQVNIGTAFWATTAGYFGNNFLPARGGELIRTFMISSRTGLSKAYVLTTALSERVADAIALLAISALVLLALPIRPGWLAHASKPLALLATGGVVAIAVLPYFDRAGRAIIERIPLAGELRVKLMLLLEHGLQGIKTFHNRGRLLTFLVLTAVIWSTDAVGTVIAAKALSLPMTLPMAFLLIAGLGLGSALPSTPGYVGIYQFVAVSALTPFGFTNTDAIAYIVVAQALSYLVLGCWGAFGFWRYRRLSPRVAES